jgi:hypothetical protein
VWTESVFIDDIDLPFEDGAQVIDQADEVQQRAAGVELHEQINIASRSGRPPHHRTEHTHPPGTVRTAEGKDLPPLLAEFFKGWWLAGKRGHEVRARQRLTGEVYHVRPICAPSPFCRILLAQVPFGACSVLSSHRREVA